MGSQGRSTGKRGRVSAERSATTPRRRRAGRLVGVRRVSAVGDEMPGHATRRQVIAGVLVPRGVRAGTNAGRRRQWPAPHCLHPKSDGPHFGVREKWRRSGQGRAVLHIRPAGRTAQNQSGAGHDHRTVVARVRKERPRAAELLGGQPELCKRTERYVKARAVQLLR